MTGDGSEEFLKKAQNFTVAELIPYKVKIILNAYNHSEEIARVCSFFRSTILPIFIQIKKKKKILCNFN